MSPPDNALRWSALAGRAVSTAHDVVVRRLALETVLLDLRSGTYHSVSAVGTRFLECMESSGTLEGAARTLAQEYGQPVERIREDLAVFVSDLQARHLVTLRPGEPSDR